MKTWSRVAWAAWAVAVTVSLLLLSDAQAWVRNRLGVRER